MSDIFRRPEREGGGDFASRPCGRETSVARLSVLLVLLSVCMFPGCTRRPGTEAVARFSLALAATSSAVDAGLDAVAANERASRDMTAAARYVAAGSREVRGAPVLPGREPTNAEIAKGVLAPGFELLAQYAQQLALISSGEATAPLSGATDALKAALGKGLDTLVAAPEFGISPEAVAAAKQASGVLLAVVEFAIEQRVTRDVAAVVERTDDDVREFGAFLKAVIGAGPTTPGLRLALDATSRQLELDRRLVLAELQRDPRVSRLDRLAVFRDIVEARGQEASADVLTQMVVVIDRLTRAHNGLRRPAEAGSRVAIDDFLASVERLNAIYQRLNAKGT